MVLVIAAVAAALDRLELGEFLLPVAKDVRLHATQFADFADGEVALGRDGRQGLPVGIFRTCLLYTSRCV